MSEASRDVRLSGDIMGFSGGYVIPVKYLRIDYILPGTLRSIISRYLSDDKTARPNTREMSLFRVCI